MAEMEASMIGSLKAIRDALNLGDVEISSIYTDMQRMIVHVYVETIKNLACPICGAHAPIYDSKPREWRHLDVGEAKCVLHYRQPRVKCPNCGVHAVLPPWAPKEKSHFTEAFEKNVMSLAASMPILQIAEHLGENDKTIWGIIGRRVEKGMAALDYSKVKSVGVDETSSKKGHNYITVFVDLSNSEVLYATEGKDSSTMLRFAEYLEAHGGSRDRIEDIAMDMSSAFISGAAAYFPNARVIFDKFHVVKMAGEAVDEVRRSESKKSPLLKGTRWIWLKNPSNLTVKEKSSLTSLKFERLDTGKAYRIKTILQDIYASVGRDATLARVVMEQWISLAVNSKLQPVMDLGASVARHIAGIIRHFATGITSAVMEGLNSRIQEAKRRSRGFRNIGNFINVVYIIASGMSAV
jgi:transposase